MGSARVVIFLVAAAGVGSSARVDASSTPVSRRRVNWYLAASRTADNAALIAAHGGAITGGYLCCGYGGILANGTFTSVPTAEALSWMAPLTSASREAWLVSSISESAVRSGAWRSVGLERAAAALAPLASAGLAGILVDYEPADNYTSAHASAYGAYLGALAAALAPLGLSVGVDVAEWGILKQEFWPAYAGRGLARFTSMTPTYNARNVSENRAFVSDALRAFPTGAFAAGVGTVLAGDTPCAGGDYLWTAQSFPPFVAWMAAAGVETVDVWRCDIDRPYPAPDPTASWFIGALGAFAAGGEE